MTLEHDESPSPGGGIRIENVWSQLPGPTGSNGPYPGGDSEERPPGGPSSTGPSEDTASQTVPLDPRIIEFSVGAIGNAAAEMTRYAGWRFSEKELDAISSALADLGLRLPAFANAILVVVAIVAGKATAYLMWVRAGKPPLNESTRRLIEAEPAEGYGEAGPEDLH